MTYYYETQNDEGTFEAKSDKKALKKAAKYSNLIILYRESDEDGTTMLIDAA